MFPPALLSPKTQTGHRSEAFRFLCGCLSAAISGNLEDEHAQMARSPAFSWNQFVDLATDQLVAPAVAYHFDLHGLDAVVPELIARYFRAMLRLNRSRNTQLRKEAMDIAVALNEIDVVPLFLKGGAGLLSGLYVDPAIRIMSDLDILVPFNRGDDCVRRLVALGYVLSLVEPHPRTHCFGSLSRTSSIAQIDLHREALAYPHEELLPARDVLSHAVEHRQGGAAFTVPSATHQIIHNIGHAQLVDHGYSYGHLPLRSLHDLAHLLLRGEGHIDWREIENRFAATQNRTALDFHCLAVRELLEAAPCISYQPGLSTRFLLRRGRFMINHPGLQRISDRVIRVFMLLKRELSSADLRARLLENMRDPQWWRRHLAMFRKGGW